MEETKALVPVDSQALESITRWGPFSKLLEKPPKTAVQHREGAKGLMYPYLKVSWVVNELNKLFGPLWYSELAYPPDVRPFEASIYDPKTGVTRKEARKTWTVVIRLVVLTPWGQVKREQAGSQVQKEGMEDGDALKGAISDGIRKAASLFGPRFGLLLAEDEQGVKLETTPLLEAVYKAGERQGMQSGEVDKLCFERSGQPPNQAKREELIALLGEINRRRG